MIDGKYNDAHPLAFTTGGIGPNPNILTHGEAMAAVDKVHLKIKIKQEINFKNKILITR